MGKIDEEMIKTFVPYFKLLRQATGWTQQDLADRTGVKRQTITAIETGKMLPSATLFLAIIGLFVVASTTIPVLSGIISVSGLKKVFTMLFTKE